MIFLDNVEYGTLVRSLCYPNNTVRLDRDTLLFIPTTDEITFYNITNRLKGTSNFKVKSPKGLYIPKMGTYKVGATNVRYINEKINDDLKIATKNGFALSSTMPGTLQDFNTIVNNTKLATLINNKPYTPGNILTKWKALFTSISPLTHKYKYIVFTPDNTLVKLATPTSILSKDYLNQNLYLNFMYCFIYKYDEFMTLLEEEGYNVIFTDYKLTFKFDISESRQRKKEEVIKLLFSNLRRMQLGITLNEETDEENEILNFDDKALQKGIDKLDSISAKKNTKTGGLTTDDSNESTSTDKEVNDIITSNDKAIVKAKKVNEIIEKSTKKELTLPPRLEKIRKRQEVIKNRNLTDILSKLEKTADYVLEDKLTKTTADQFNKFSIADMDIAYESISKKDKIEIGESFNSNSVPLYMTNFNEKEDIVSKDTKSNLVQYTFESPYNSNERHTFTMRVPTLRDGKFLHMNGSDKVMIRQKMAKPIIRLKDNVAFTSYYNKMFINPTAGNLTKRTAIIKKFIRHLRKNNTSTVLSKWCNFTPAYSKARSNNLYGPEVLEISRYITSIIYDENTFLNLDNKTNLIAKVDSAEYYVRTHDDVIECRILDDVIETDIITVFKAVIDKINDPVFESFYTFIKEKPSTNRVYSKCTLMNQNIPLLLVALHSCDENLLLILDRLKTDYDLEYTIKPITQDKKEKFTDDRLDTDRFEFSDFVLDVKYNGVANRSLLVYLHTLDLSSYDSLNLTGLVESCLDSSNLIMYMDNFRDLFIDPITFNVMNDLGIPSDYTGALIYCNYLLFNYDRSMSDISLKNERMPSNAEIIQGISYKVMADAYVKFANRKRRGSTKATFSVEKDAVINYLNVLPNVEESSKINPVQHVDKTLTISNKGISGINNKRSNVLEKRMWDKSFYGIMSDVSPYNESTGVTKHLSVNPNITDIRGYFKSLGPDEVAPDQLMSVSEALGTFSQKHDSSPRTAMGMQQFNHLMGVQGAEPSLVTYGMDESLSQLDTDFCHKMEQDGEIISVNDRFIKVKYVDGKESLFAIDEIERNAAKAFFIPNKMKINSKLNIKEGVKLKKDDIIAYNENVYKEVGDDVVFMSGPIVNVALANTKYSYEDAILVSEVLADKLSAKTLKRIAIKIHPKNKIVYAIDNLSNIKAGDFVFKYSEDTGSEYMNDLYDLNALDDFLLKTKKSSYNGTIKDIYVYHKLSQAEEETMDITVKNFFNKIHKLYQMKYDTNKLEQNIPKYEVNRIVEHVTKFTDNRKNKVNGDTVDKGEILIEYFIEVEQNFSIGDKLTVGNTALKGVVSKVIDIDQRPIGVETKRPIDAILSPYSPLSRMIYSLLLNGLLTASMQEFNKNIKKLVDK